MKSLLSFGFPFLLRTIIPGMVGTLALSPLIAAAGIKIDIAETLGKSLSSIGLLFVGFSLSIGFLLSFVDDTMYKIFEGYICWPTFIRRYLTKRLNKRIKRKIKKANATQDEIEKKILWDWLMRFPLKKESKKVETEAVLPTMLGNILSSYEDYPESRYGIIAIFFWPRLWLSVDNETRKEINTIWAEADCVTYISFILFWAFMLYLLVFIFSSFDIPTLILGSIGKPVTSLAIGAIVMLFTPTLFLVLAIVSIVLSYVFYRLSLPLHVRNGTFFQSLFDLHRDKLGEMHQINKIEEELKSNIWRKTFNYLKYGYKE